MTIATLFLGLSFAFQAGPLTPKLKPAPVANQVLAKVNGVDITTQQVQDLLWDLHGTAVLNDIVSYEAIRQEALRLKVVVTDQEIDRRIDEEVQRLGQNLQPGLTPGQILAQSGYTWSRLYVNTKSTLMLLKIAFQEFKPASYVRISTISVKPKSTADSDIALTTKALQDAYNRIQKGETWDKMVAEYVTDAEGRRTNGYLGWRELELFDEGSRRDIGLLKRGEVSKPIKTPNGIQIFRVESHGSEATPEELDQMRTELAEDLQMKVYARLRKSTKIERLYPQ